jgi:hypothetical protein
MTLGLGSLRISISTSMLAVHGIEHQQASHTPRGMFLAPPSSDASVRGTSRSFCLLQAGSHSLRIWCRPPAIPRLIATKVRSSRVGKEMTTLKYHWSELATSRSSSRALFCHVGTFMGNCVEVFGSCSVLGFVRRQPDSAVASQARTYALPR